MSQFVRAQLDQRQGFFALGGGKIGTEREPTTTPTGTPVPAITECASDTHTGLTMAQAKRKEAASSHTLTTCSRVDSGFSSVWSNTAASAFALAKAVVANPETSKYPEP